MKRVYAFLILLLVLPLVFTAHAQEITPREDLVIADLGQPPTNPWDVNRQRFEDCVADALNVELIKADDSASEAKHVDQAEALIARQPDGLIFNPLTSPAGIQVARLLEENQIPGVAVGRLVVSSYEEDYDGEYFIGQVTQNNQTWGEAIAQHVVDSGFTKVAMIWNQKGVTSAEEIWQGALTVFNEHPEVEIIAETWDDMTRENGILYAEQYLARFQPGEIDAIVVLGAVAGTGSLFAIEQAERGDVAIITTDDDEQVAELIRDGRLDWTIGGHWMVGGFGLIQLYDYLHGFPVVDPQPRVNMIPVDIDNVDAYAEAFLQGCVLTPEQIRDLSRVFNPDADLAMFMDEFSKNWQDFIGAEEISE